MIKSLVVFFFLINSVEKMYSVMSMRNFPNCNGFQVFHIPFFHSNFFFAIYLYADYFLFLFICLYITIPLTKNTLSTMQILLPKCAC